MAQCKRIYLPVQETRETWVQSLGQEDILEEERAPHSSFLPEKISHGQRSLVGCIVHGITRGSDMTATKHPHVSVS